MHPVDLPTAITHARDFEAAELEANYAQANYLSLLVTPEDATTNNSKFNSLQTTLTNNIPPVMVTENESLTAIFSFKLEETINPSLFSGAALKEKPITTIYSNVKVDGHSIKLILDSHRVDCTASARIITADGATKTPIGEIDDFSIEVNDIIVPIKIETPKSSSLARIVNTHEYQPRVATSSLFTHHQHHLSNLKKKKQNPSGKHTKSHGPTLTTMNCCQYSPKTTTTMERRNKEKNLPEKPSSTLGLTTTKSKEKEKKKEENIPEETTTAREITSGWKRKYLHEPIKEPSYISLKYKNCRKKLFSIGAWVVKTTRCEPITIASSAIGNNMATQKDKARMWNNIPSREGTCDTSCQYMILISDWVSRAISHLDGYPHDENKIWQMANAKVEGISPSKILEIKNNLPEPTDIVLVLNPDAFINLKNSPEEFHEHYQNLALMKKDCASESESSSNSDSNSNNNDNKNNGSKLKWFSDNDEGIMPECMHDINTGFDLRYPKKNAIKLEPYLHTCIDLKIALEIPATTMVQLASRNSLAKKGINIRGGIINAGYIGNIIAMLQNDSKKTYVIEPNERIAQAIFLPLVKIAQLVSVGNKKKLGITAREIQEFGLTGRIDVPVNMVEEEIIGQGEIISTTIERREKEQEQIFEAEATLCKSEEIGLINLHISAKSHNHIKISIYNNTRNIVEILEGTTLGYLTMEIENQAPSSIPDFPQLCKYVNITSQTIYGQNKCYLLQPEQLEQMNMGNLDPL
ncbi:hypothetical protein G9A89_010856 [Geosiphon pyriformis]|nr:hypothetical protein G9A89_010856 [Geosiphon pyriformis]